MKSQFAIRKGHFCAVGERHSSTMMRGSTGESWSYTIGRVRKASTKGDMIKEATIYRYGTELRCREDEQGRWWQSFAIQGADYQRMAGELVGQEWPSLEHMRAAFGVS